ncbi:hypothetical protein, partial [Mycoplasmopsis bovis]|uniref:hypothetical protein n=1 Tax=Mycoplasmopsis bovis TaxID=28903 RepID=UPI001CF0F76E
SCCELVPAPDPGLVPAPCCELVPAPDPGLVPAPDPGLAGVPSKEPGSSCGILGFIFESDSLSGFLFSPGVLFSP